MNRTARTLTAPLLATLLAGSVLISAPAMAGDDDNEVLREGSCSGRTDWKVKAKTDDGGLEFEGEIDSNRSGQTWRWRIVHNGSITERGRSTTGGRSGSFDVERKLPNRAGTDSFVFRAVHRATGEICRGELSY